MSTEDAAAGYRIIWTLAITLLLGLLLASAVSRVGGAYRSPSLTPLPTELWVTMENHHETTHYC